MMNDYEARFAGVSRLFSPAAAQRLRRARVAVIGVGGVGSWAVEALARSGVGHLTLVDLDDVCISNVNRQLHAVGGEFGRPKVQVMGERVRAIHPQCQVEVRQEFFLPSTATAILQTRYDYVIDAIDSPSKKTLLISLCRERHYPVITTGAAAGRRDPTALRVRDLSEVTHDRLLQQVRKQLRTRYNFPREGQPLNVPAVASIEPIENRLVPVTPGEADEFRLDCDSGFGTACFVTGTFGLVAAGYVIQQLASP